MVVVCPRYNIVRPACVLLNQIHTATIFLVSCHGQWALALAKMCALPTLIHKRKSEQAQQWWTPSSITTGIPHSIFSTQILTFPLPLPLFSHPLLLLIPLVKCIARTTARRRCRHKHVSVTSGNVDVSQQDEAFIKSKISLPTNSTSWYTKMYIPM